jgi:hypothetical protein
MDSWAHLKNTFSDLEGSVAWGGGGYDTTRMRNVLDASKLFFEDFFKVSSSIFYKK